MHGIPRTEFAAKPARPPPSGDRVLFQILTRRSRVAAVIRLVASTTRHGVSLAYALASVSVNVLIVTV